MALHFTALKKGDRERVIQTFFFQPILTSFLFKLRLLQISSLRFEDALLKTPNNPLYLVRWAAILLELSKIHEEESLKYLDLASEKYELAQLLEPQNLFTLFSYGESLLMKASKLKEESQKEKLLDFASFKKNNRF